MWFLVFCSSFSVLQYTDSGDHMTSDEVVLHTAHQILESSTAGPGTMEFRVPVSHTDLQQVGELFLYTDHGPVLHTAHQILQSFTTGPGTMEFRVPVSDKVNYFCIRTMDRSYIWHTRFCSPPLLDRGPWNSGCQCHIQTYNRLVNYFCIRTMDRSYIWHTRFCSPPLWDRGPWNSGCQCHIQTYNRLVKWIISVYGPITG